MVKKLFLRTMIAVFLAALFIPAASFAASGREVSNFEELSGALMDAGVTSIVLTDDIEIPEDIDVNMGRKSLTIDGRGHSLTFNGVLRMESFPSKMNITLKDALIHANGDVIETMAEDVGSGVVFTFEDIDYYGGTLVSLAGGCVRINGGDYNFEGWVGQPMIEADVVEVSGQVRMADAHDKYAAPLIMAVSKLYLSDGAVFEASMPREASLGEAEDVPNYDGYGLIRLPLGAKIEFERIKSFKLSYYGGDICEHEHSEDCGYIDPETYFCNHDCASERYACCRNAMIHTDDFDPAYFEAHASYAGDYSISLKFLDGISKQYDRLGAITCDQLLGVRSMEITYTPPETINVKGQIIWDDEDNAYDTRPKSVRIALYRDGIATDRQMTVSKKNFTFADEAFQDKDGHIYTYTVRQIDDLSPEYKTTYKDKGNIITNTLVTAKVKVHYDDVRTGAKIAESDVIKVPMGYPLTIRAKDISGYQLIDGAGAEIVIGSVNKDMEHTFHYNEMLMFKGTHVFGSGVSANVRYSNLTVDVYRNVWQDFESDYRAAGGIDRTPQEIGAHIALMPGFALPATHKIDGFIIDTRLNPAAYETTYQWRKYDDHGNEYIYSFATRDTAGFLVTFAVDEAWNLNINVEGRSLTVTVIAVIREDPQSTSGNGSQTQRTERTFSIGDALDVTLPESITVGDRTAAFVDATYDGQNGTRITIDGRRITSSSLLGDVTITANYRFPLDIPEEVIVPQ